MENATELPAPRDTSKLTGATAFWIAVVATVLVHVVPFGHVIGRPLVWFATMVHELGHGLTAILVGGDFGEFKMWTDGSGVAATRWPDEGAGALVAAGGLVGPSIGAMIGFIAARGARMARIALVAIALLMAWALVFKARNAFGVGFVASIAVVTAGLGLFAPRHVAQVALMFLSVQLALSLWSDLDYMFSAVAVTAEGARPSDSARIAEALGGPYWIWGALVALTSLAAIALGARIGLTGSRTPRIQSAEST